MKVTFIEHSGFMITIREKSRHLTAVRLSMSLHHTAMPIIMIQQSGN